MAHPDDVQKVVRMLGRHLQITAVSDPYPNRKGPGVRVYIEGKLRAELDTFGKSDDGKEVRK
jgi:hypothetical protein